MISFSMKQHLFDPYYYQGLGLLSLISLFTIPISLEIIFAHRDLWFDSNHIWQNVCVQWCWELWMAFGIVGLTSWISTCELKDVFEEDRWKLRIIFSVLAFLVFILSVLPSCYWLILVNLADWTTLIFKSIYSVLILGSVSFSALLLHQSLAMSSNILLSSSIGLILLQIFSQS